MVLLNVVYKISRILLMRFIPQTISKKYATIASMLMFDVKFNCLLVCSSIPSNILILFKLRTTQKWRNLSLGLGSRPGLAKVRAKYEAQESHFMLPGVQKKVRERTFTLPNELSLWELESQWTPKFWKRDFKGQNPLDWRVLYIIGKILEFRCLKWAHMTHLDI